MNINQGCTRGGSLRAGIIFFICNAFTIQAQQEARQESNSMKLVKPRFFLASVTRQQAKEPTLRAVPLVVGRFMMTVRIEAFSPTCHSFEHR